ncbi:hypothetical protein BDY24DRAFT_197211 [Mrakia frigida]|uniref:uncharacterized protein n=1 Tax=Mrakia frigida TaxID=29902 RepID=UPI003FCBFA43
MAFEKEKVPHLDVDKRRDFNRMKRFECDGTFSITATPSTSIVKISYNHQCNHEPYETDAISDEVLQEIVKYASLRPSAVSSLRFLSFPPFRS